MTQSSEKEAKRIYRKWPIRAGIILTIMVEVYFLCHLPAVILTAMFIIGRSDCSHQKTVATMEWKLNYLDVQKEMKRLSWLTKKDGSLQLWMTPQGEFWMPESSVPLIFGVLAEQEIRIYGTGPLGIRKGDVVLDCGADIGTFTRLALRMGASLVVAIEPATEKEPCLRRNFHDEIKNGKVVISAKGVWNREESMPLVNGTVISATQSRGQMIQLTTIDKLVRELNLNRVDFIKMDIAGAETQALEGARQTLAKFRPRLAIATEHYSGEAKEVRDKVRSTFATYNYECGPCAYLDGHICPHVAFFY